MNPIQAAIAAGITVVAFLFSAFGGFLTDIAPPRIAEGPGQNFSVGLASFVALIILLLIQYLASLGKNAKNVRLVWIIVAVTSSFAFMWFALAYQTDSAKKTFYFVPAAGGEPVRYIMGAELTQFGKDYTAGHTTTGPADLMKRSGADDPTTVWTRDSILDAQSVLIRRYQILIILVCISLFSLGFLVASGVKSVRGPEGGDDK